MCDSKKAYHPGLALGFFLTGWIGHMALELGKHLVAGTQASPSTKLSWSVMLAVKCLFGGPGASSKETLWYP